MYVSNACDAYSDTWNNHYDIYDFLGYHICNKQTKKLVLTPLPYEKTMAHGKGGNLCRVPRQQGTRQRCGHVILSSWLATLFCRGSRMAHDKPFAVCPIYSTRQRPALPIPGCRVRFAVCGTRQRVCRGLLGLYRVPLTHGKGGGLP